MNPPLRALSYSRVSTTQNQSTDAQQAELRRYCSARGWTLTKEIVDHGYSGGTDQRPGLKELLALVRRREVDAVVVTKLDRLFRSLKHLILTLEEFEQLGVTFVAVRDSLDWSTSAGKFFIQVLGSLGQFERELIRKRVKAGLVHAKNCGKRLGRPRSPKEADILRLRSEGLSHREITRQLEVSRGLVHRTLKRVTENLTVTASVNPRKDRSAE
ncbi:recombinase family protein [Bdellovibrionota bacterium FG-2]